MQTRTYRISKDRSRIWAEVRATLQTLEVQANDFQGTFQIGIADGGIAAGVAPEGSFELDVRMLHGPNRLFDVDLMKFLEARKYPTISGSPREIVPSGGAYRVRGDLQMHGEKAPVEGTVSVLEWGERELRLRGEMEVKLETFRLKPRRLLMLKVDPTLRIFGEVVALCES